MTAPVALRFEGEIAWITIDHPPVNATSTPVRAGLLRALEEVQTANAPLAVLACAGRTFVAGGDLSEFDAPPAPPHLPEVVDALERSAVPVVALLQGTVLGGGFELAMACAHRIARPGTRFGLPEVQMGLIPGAGGSQRAPRLLGWDLAVRLACLGHTATAEELLALGALDAITDTPEVALRDLTARRRTAPPISARPAPPLAEGAWAAFEAQVQRHAKGRRAPAHALTALSWAQTPYAEGQPKERALHLDLRASDESIALRHVFFAERAVARPDPGGAEAPQPLSHVTVVGGGLMGCGIAAACLLAGLDVLVLDRDSRAAAQAQTRVAEILDGAQARGKLDAASRQAAQARLTTGTEYSAAAGTDVAIEAVFEDTETKRAVLAALAQTIPPTALLATNTSYLDPNQLFAGLPGPARCLGLHFFSPAHIMKLVEVVRADQTSAQTLATGFALARKLRKTPVLSGVCDGFIGNRILAATRRAAEYLLADGSLPEEIDAAMRAFGMAMGPFEAQDMAGLQIAQANRRRLDAVRDPQERYVTLSDTLCDRGRLGQRSGAGWYRYVPGSRTAEVDGEVTALLAAYWAAHGAARRPLAPEDIQERLLAVMANEGARIVDEGIAQSAGAVDVVKIAGYGFPRWRGGPMHWASRVGPLTVARALDRVVADSPTSWPRATLFEPALFEPEGKDQTR